MPSPGRHASSCSMTPYAAAVTAMTAIVARSSPSSPMIQGVVVEAFSGSHASALTARVKVPAFTTSCCGSFARRVILPHQCPSGQSWKSPSIVSETATDLFSRPITHRDRNSALFAVDPRSSPSQNDEAVEGAEAVGTFSRTTTDDRDEDEDGGKSEAQSRRRRKITTARAGGRSSTSGRSKVEKTTPTDSNGLLKMGGIALLLALLARLVGGIFPWGTATTKAPNFVFYESSVYQTTTVDPYNGKVETNRQEKFRSNLPGLGAAGYEDGSTGSAITTKEEVAKERDQMDASIRSFLREQEQMEREMNALFLQNLW